MASIRRRTPTHETKAQSPVARFSRRVAAWRSSYPRPELEAASRPPGAGMGCAPLRRAVLLTACDAGRLAPVTRARLRGQPARDFPGVQPAGGAPRRARAGLAALPG